MRGWDGTVEGGKKHKKDSDHNDTTSVELVKDQYGIKIMPRQSTPYD